MNIHDIAKEAGVSIATVSRVINHKENVNEETRKRIEEILKKHNYKPNAIARGLASKSMRTIAVLSVDVRVPNYARAIYTIEQEFSALGYVVNVCNTGGELSRTIHYTGILSENQIAGMIFIGSIFNRLCRDKAIIDNLSHIPVISANGQLALEQSCSVLVDDVAGIELAYQHLHSKGHERIFYVRDLDTDAAAIKQVGFRRAAELAGAKDAQVLQTSYGLDGGRQAAERILALSPSQRPTAVIFGEDLTAVGAVKAFQAAGLRIPQDMAVTGYNNSEYALTSSPELSSVDNKPELMASLCVEQMVDILGGGEIPKMKTIQPDLIVRQSS